MITVVESYTVHSLEHAQGILKRLSGEYTKLSLPYKSLAPEDTMLLTHYILSSGEHYWNICYKTHLFAYKADSNIVFAPTFAIKRHHDNINTRKKLISIEI